jgi:hypothetical protein
LTRRTWLALLALGLVVAGLTAVAAGGGVRGSDQYWYTADVETLIRTGVSSTNTVFPVGLLGPSHVLPPPFIHNVLSLYLAALPALAFGPYGGWLILNLVATLSTAALIFLAARTVASRWAALACAVLYPFLPITFWYTAQPLSEASTSLFAALAIYLLAIAGRRAGLWLALVGALGLLYLSRESYLPLLWAAPIGFLLMRIHEDGGRVRAALIPTAVIAAASMAVVAVAGLAFANDNVRFSYTRLIHAAVPGSTSNMWFNFDLSAANIADQLPFDPGLVAAKLGQDLLEQFVRFDSAAFALFYWTFNGLTLVAIVMLWRRRHRVAQLRFIIGALSFVAVHVITIAIFQNQARYLVPALPGLLVVLAIAIDGVPSFARRLRDRPTAIIVGLAIVALAPMAALAVTSRREGLDQAVVERDTRQLLDARIPDVEPLLIAYEGNPQVFAYAARPRLVLYLWPDYAVADVDRLLRAFPSRWLLAPSNSSLLTTLGSAVDAAAGDIYGADGHWVLYHLRQRLPP